MREDTRIAAGLLRHRDRTNNRSRKMNRRSILQTTTVATKVEGTETVTKHNMVTVVPGNWISNTITNYTAKYGQYLLCTQKNKAIQTTPNTGLHYQDQGGIVSIDKLHVPINASSNH